MKPCLTRPGHNEVLEQYAEMGKARMAELHGVRPGTVVAWVREAKIALGMIARKEAGTPKYELHDVVNKVVELGLDGAARHFGISHRQMQMYYDRAVSKRKPPKLEDDRIWLSRIRKAEKMAPVFIPRESNC